MLHSCHSYNSCRCGNVIFTYVVHTHMLFIQMRLSKHIGCLDTDADRKLKYSLIPPNMRRFHQILVEFHQILVELHQLLGKLHYVLGKIYQIFHHILINLHQILVELHQLLDKHHHILGKIYQIFHQILV